MMKSVPYLAAFAFSVSWKFLSAHADALTARLDNVCDQRLAREIFRTQIKFLCVREFPGACEAWHGSCFLQEAMRNRTIHMRRSGLCRLRRQAFAAAGHSRQIIAARSNHHPTG